jgi:hypothetical protein
VQSVTAQYLNSIYQAISERAEKLVVDNKTIRIDENCGLFLVLENNNNNNNNSVNSESKVKADLPDTLTQLFR